MKFKKDQRITYKNGEKGTILTTARNHPKYPVVSITDDGEICAHTSFGKACPGYDRYDIMPPVPQGKDLVGLFCGVSDVSLEDAQERAKNFKYPRTHIIKDYDSSDKCPYKDVFDINWRYAWPVSESDINKYLWEGNDGNTC